MVCLRRRCDSRVRIIVYFDCEVKRIQQEYKKTPEDFSRGLCLPPVCHRPAAVRLRPPRQAGLPAKSAFCCRPPLCLAFSEKCHVVNHCLAFRGSSLPGQGGKKSWRDFDIHIAARYFTRPILVQVISHPIFCLSQSQAARSKNRFDLSPAGCVGDDERPAAPP